MTGFGLRAALAACGMVVSATAASTVCRSDLIEALPGDRTIAFRVEVADTPAAQARGLMHRGELPADAGMLFLFDRAEPRAFWMRDTPLPLDMLFIDAGGRVCGVVREAAPLSETLRHSGCSALAVLEINGGLAARLGIDVGTALRHPAFGPDAAAPCP